MKYFSADMIFTVKRYFTYLVVTLFLGYLTSDIQVNLNVFVDLVLSILFVCFYVLSIIGTTIIIRKLLLRYPRLVRLILTTAIIIISIISVVYIFNEGSGYELVDILLSAFSLGGIFIIAPALRDFMDTVFSVKMKNKITINSVMKAFVFSIVGLFVITALLFRANVYMYQQVINEGSVLMEERCNLLESEINKNRALQANIQKQILEMDSDEDFQDFEENMWEFRHRLHKEGEISYEWNQKQEAFLNKWETRFFTKKELYELFKIQLDMYESERKYSIALADLIENPYVEHNSSELNNAIEVLDIYRKQFVLFSAQAKEANDYRRPYLNIPDINCASEDFDTPGIPQENKNIAA